ncbi:MAG TPA: lytic transglycosylase domain-containing protein [Candidatus Nitrosotenuis sp.]|jgi:soluble lytic murein transglycosylase-like protein|nr:lytic transglycosylase domain-containing protein [Candidatus Nitrosotenuis sp.]
MSIYDRINAIESKIQALEARLAARTPITPSAGPPLLTSGSPQGAPVSFEKLLNSLSEEQRFRPGASRSPGAPADPSAFDGIIREAAQKYNLDEALIRAVIRQESGFNPQATSPCGAMGLMQLMPGTAADMGVTDAYDPRQNIMGGARYLRQMLDTFGGNLTKAVAAYNAGPGNVQQYGGVPPFEETQNYVACVLEFYRQYKGQ